MKTDKTRAGQAMSRTFVILDILEEDATEEKRRPQNRNESTMHYYQGRADAFRIAMATMQEEYKGGIPT